MPFDGLSVGGQYQSQHTPLPANEDFLKENHDNAYEALEAPPTPKNGIIAAARARLKVKSWKNLGIKGGLAVGAVATLTGGGLIVAGTVTLDPLMVLIGTITAIAGAALFLITLVAAAVIAYKKRAARRRAEAEARGNAEALAQPQPQTTPTPRAATGSESITLQSDDDDDDEFNAIITKRPPNSSFPTGHSVFEDQDPIPTLRSSSSHENAPVQSDQPLEAVEENLNSPQNIQSPSTSSSSQEESSVQTPNSVKPESLQPGQLAIDEEDPDSVKEDNPLSQLTLNTLNEYFKDVDLSSEEEESEEKIEASQNPRASLSSPSSAEPSPINVAQPENVSDNIATRLRGLHHSDPTESDVEEFEGDAAEGLSDFFQEEFSASDHEGDEKASSAFHNVFSSHEGLKERVKEDNGSSRNLTNVFHRSTTLGVTEEESKTQHSVAPDGVNSPPSPAVKAEVYKIFNNLMLISKEASNDPFSEASMKTLTACKETLPEAMQKQMGENGSWTKASLENFVKEMLGLSDSIDLGGHGGTLTAKVTFDNQTYFLFLKPLDAVESRNYKVINYFSPEVSKYMPSIYGEISINNTRYLMMENTRMDANGNALKQLADIKLAGKVDGLDNPIADQDEMQKCRDRKKNGLDYLQMSLGAKFSPNYMIADGPKAFRFFRYGSSASNLQKVIEDANLTEEQIYKLKDALTQLQADLNSSPFAFIGASVIFVQQEDGSIRPLLIDPAHVRFSSTISGDSITQVPGLSGEEIPKLYFGSDADFHKQRMSNIFALNILNKDITIDLAKKPSKPILVRTESSRNLLGPEPTDNHASRLLDKFRILGFK